MGPQKPYRRQEPSPERYKALSPLEGPGEFLAMGLCRPTNLGIKTLITSWMSWFTTLCFRDRQCFNHLINVPLPDYFLVNTGLICSFKEFDVDYYTSFQNTEFLLDDKRVLILNEMPLSICRSTILRYC